MNLQDANRASGAAVAFIIGSVIFAVLAVVVKLSVSVPDINAAREAQRSAALAKIRANEFTNLTEFGWIDVSRGIVRLPIDVAIEKTAQAWTNPAQARADLIAREEKAVKPLPARPVRAHDNSGDIFE